VKLLLKPKRKPLSAPLAAVGLGVLFVGLAVALAGQSSPQATRGMSGTPGVRTPGYQATPRMEGGQTPGFRGTPSDRMTPGTGPGRGESTPGPGMRTTPAPATTPMR
jgi:hypothetical protein